MWGACTPFHASLYGLFVVPQKHIALDVLLQADKADCTLTKKARKITAAQHKRQADTFRLYQAKRRVRHDAFPLRGKAERQLPRRKIRIAAYGRRHTGGAILPYSHSPSVKSVAGIG